jgi:hypothetical protein
MIYFKSVVVAGIVTVLLCAGPLHAHHSVAASYDTSQTITVTGVVTSVEWRNPHVILHLDVKNNDNSVTDWRMEMQGANALSAAGIDSGVLVLGDQISVRVWTARNGTKYGNVRNLLLPDGRNLDVGDRWPRR